MIRPAAIAPRYTVTRLDLPAGPATRWQRTTAADLNEKGEVVGWATAPEIPGKIPTTAEFPHLATLWRQGKAINLGSFGGDFSEALGINDQGQIVGYSYLSRRPNPDSSPYTKFAFLWQNGKMTRLRGLADDEAGSTATSIDNHGRVVGELARGKRAGGRAFLWQAGKVRFLPPGLPNDINAKGDLVGRASDYEGNALLWRNGRSIPLPMPKGDGWIRGRANAINESGVIVGAAEKKTNFPQTVLQALLWKNQTVTVLSAQRGSAADINNRGAVVGYAEKPGSRYESYAFLYSKGHMIDLNTCLPPNSGWVLIAATAINDKGQIAGNGLYQGNRRAFLLTPSQPQRALH
jgi:probable HAF family extracellular repeat protein